MDAMQSFPDAAPGLPTGPGLPDAGALRLRSVHRAVAELRRGTPVLLRDAAGTDLPGTNLVVLAAETAGASASAW